MTLPRLESDFFVSRSYKSVAYTRKEKQGSLFSNFLRFFFLFKKIIYTERGRDRQREKQAPHREPNVELDPRTPGSHPEPKADAQPLSYPGAPEIFHIPSISGQIRFLLVLENQFINSFSFVQIKQCANNLLWLILCLSFDFGLSKN